LRAQAVAATVTRGLADSVDETGRQVVTRHRQPGAAEARGRRLP
jgi:hypothetical protein